MSALSISLIIAIPLGFVLLQVLFLRSSMKEGTRTGELFLDPQTIEDWTAIPTAFSVLTVVLQFLELIDAPSDLLILCAVFIFMGVFQRIYLTPLLGFVARNAGIRAKFSPPLRPLLLMNLAATLTIVSVLVFNFLIASTVGSRVSRAIVLFAFSIPVGIAFTMLAGYRPKKSQVVMGVFVLAGVSFLIGLTSR